MNMVASISQRLKEILEERNITQTTLANLTGIPKTTMSDYCSGKFEPKSNNLVAISNALNINFYWLMGYDVPKRNSTLNEITSVLMNMNETDLKKVKDLLVVVFSNN